VKAVFSSRFKADLDAEAERYRLVSERLASGFKERVAGQAREIIKWQGGDHVGPHGFPCRRTTPFPFYVCFSVVGDTIYFLGLVHERRHPNFLKKRMGNDV
jgi:hypothetical protein